MRYPIGKFEAPLFFTDRDILNYTEVIRALPGKMHQAVAGLTEAQLDTPYRSGGWTIRQVVHHVPDSHMNSIMRFKWAMTEDSPIIKPYNETAFALLADYKMPVETSLHLLAAIHAHLVVLFESFTQADLERTFYNPKSQINFTLKMAMALYAWHSEHHLAHITETVKQFT